MIRLFIAIFFTLFISCHGSKKTTGNQAVKQEETAVQDIYRFHVSFISMGSGTDFKAKQAYLEFIRSFEEKNKIKIMYEVAHWGREGESDFCFRLSELGKDGQIQFIADSKAYLKTSKLVRIAENSPCKKERKK